jgi:chymotrypsin-like protease
MERVIVALLLMIAIGAATTLVFQRRIAAQQLLNDSSQTVSADHPPPPTPPTGDLAAAASAATPDSARKEQANKSKIVGGENANPKDFPWMAAIGEVNDIGEVSSYCAGTLVGPQWLLTAAHCRVLKGDYAVLGRADLKTNAGSVVAIVDTIVHPDYCPRNLDRDLALLKLANAQSIHPIALVDASEAAIRRAEFISIAGWGRLGEYKYELPNKLQKADVVVFSQTSCFDNYDHIGKEITDYMFCAQGKPGPTITDACKGDSGGPIVAFEGVLRRATLIGVISKGEGCARRSFPGVYTKLSMLQEWVQQCQSEPTPNSCRKPSQPAC